MKIVDIQKCRDGGSIMFKYDNDIQLWLKGVGFNNGKFFDKYPGAKDANKIKMSTKDIHQLICAIIEHYQCKIKDQKSYFQSTEKWKNFKPGDMK